jgi:hypothetical protein
MGFLWLQYILESKGEWSLWQAEPSAFPPIDSTNSVNTRPRLESLKEKTNDSREMSVLLLVTFGMIP